MRTDYIFFLLMVLLLAGCERMSVGYAVAELPTLSEIDFNTTKVSPELVKAYLIGYKGVVPTRADEIDIVPILNDSDTVMYLVNYPEGGWEVLSADTRAPKVLVMCESGSITVDELASNPVEDGIYTAMGDYISYLHDNPTVNISDSTDVDDWSDVAATNVNASTREIESWVLIGTTVLEDDIEEQDHLTETKWGQGEYGTPTWNVCAPYRNSNKINSQRCIMGCVPVAAAQMLYYLHYKLGVPDKIYARCNTNAYIADGDSTVTLMLNEDTFCNDYNNYVWGAMPKDSVGATSAEYGYVSSLMLYLGALMGSEYKNKNEALSTSTLNTKIYSMFNEDLEIYCEFATDWEYETVRSQIMDKKMPVVMSIYYMLQNVRHGHTVIVDGCYDRLRILQKRYVWESLSGPQYKTEVETETTTMVAINWGYDGEGMQSGGSTVWYNYYVYSWSGGGSTYTGRSLLTYGFKKNVI